MLNKFDADQNGELDSKEFPAFLVSIDAEPLSYNELCATIQELDADNNGKISLQEFKIWYRSKIVILPALVENYGREGRAAEP